jgi:tRNA-dihydrouridine synthase 1
MQMDSLSFIAAPMVNQSDLPFRLLVRKYGATMAYTQMLIPDKLLNDQEYLELHQRDLVSSTGGLERPVVVQLCGNDPEVVVRAGKKLQMYCDGIGVYDFKHTNYSLHSNNSWLFFGEVDQI